MTLVLRYVDRHRLIDVSDRRVTESVVDVVTGHTDEAVKAFFTRGLVVSYSGLHEIADGLTTRAWVEDALGVAGDAELREALAHLASVLPSIIAPPLRHEPLDIRRCRDRRRARLGERRGRLHQQCRWARSVHVV